MSYLFLSSAKTGENQKGGALRHLPILSYFTGGLFGPPNMCIGLPYRSRGAFEALKFLRDFRAWNDRSRQSRASSVSHTFSGVNYNHSTKIQKQKPRPRVGTLLLATLLFFLCHNRWTSLCIRSPCSKECISGATTPELLQLFYTIAQSSVKL